MIIYSRTALAQDVHGNLTRLTTVGAELDAVKTSDQDSQQLLEEIYKQLKILNFQMATISENYIDEIN